MKDLLKCLVDESSLTYYKDGYGKTMICAYANIDGWAVGIVANNREVVKTKTGEMQFGGVIYSDSADKAARFIMLCNQKKLPCTKGFGAGKEADSVRRDQVSLLAASA